MPIARVLKIESMARTASSGAICNPLVAREEVAPTIKSSSYSQCDVVELTFLRPSSALGKRIIKLVQIAVTPVVASRTENRSNPTLFAARLHKYDECIKSPARESKFSFHGLFELMSVSNPLGESKLLIYIQWILLIKCTETPASCNVVRQQRAFYWQTQRRLLVNYILHTSIMLPQTRAARAARTHANAFEHFIWKYIKSLYGAECISEKFLSGSLLHL